MAVDFSVLSEKRHVNRLRPVPRRPGRKRPGQPAAFLMTNILFYAGLAIFSLSLTSISFLLLHGKSENTESLGRIGKNLPAGLRIHTQRDRFAAAVPPHSGRHVHEQGHRRNEAAYRRRTQRAGQRQPERLHGRSGTRSGARRTDDPPARGGRAHEDTARLQPFHGPDDRQVFPADHPARSSRNSGSI